MKHVKRISLPKAAQDEKQLVISVNLVLLALLIWWAKGM